MRYSIILALQHLHAIVSGKENRGWLHGSYWCAWSLDCGCGGPTLVVSGFLHVEFPEKKINRGYRRQQQQQAVSTCSIDVFQ